jgi:hypothetical protein
LSTKRSPISSSFKGIRIKNPPKYTYDFSKIRLRNPPVPKIAKPVKPKTTIKATKWTTGAAARQRRGLSERGRLARIQVQNYKAQKIIKIQKGRNAASGRPWRGPPGALGDDVIVEILPTVDLAMDAAGIHTGTNIDWKVLWNSINQFYLDIAAYMKDYIGRPFPRQEGVVPTDTGQLRRKMWQSIERQWYSKTKMPMTPGQLKKAAENGDPLLMVVLNTGNLMYAKPVNQMPTKMVAHPHKGSRNYGRGGPLWDPSAKEGWYEKVLLNGRNRAQTVNHLLQPILGNRPKLLEVFYK